MPNDFTLKITKVTQEQAYSADGKLTDVVRVDFLVGEHGPFSKRFTSSGFDQNAAKLELETFRQSIQQLAM